MTIRRWVKLENIILDDEIYPRSFTDFRTVGTYAEAMRAGAEFPPLVIAKYEDVHYLLDGWHRYHAMKQNEIEKALVETLDIPRSEWYAKSLELNIKNGRPLTQKEKIQAIFRLRREGKDDMNISQMMQLTTDYMHHLIESKAIITNEKIGNGISLKPALAEVKEKIEPKKIVDIERLQRNWSGQKQFNMIQQVIDLIERDLVHVEDERVMERMEKLAKVLSSWMADLITSGRHEKIKI